MLLRPFKEITKYLLRCAAHCRLHFLPLSESSAEWWVRTIRRWPAIFDDEQIRRRTRLDLGIAMDLGLVDHIERELRLKDEWDRPVKTALMEVLKPGDAFLDLGANIGYFTLLASKLVGPTGTVIAVEPSIRALRKLTHHLWLNQCDNVLLLSCAAGDDWRRVSLGLANESNIGGSALLTPGESNRRIEPALLAPLDELLQSTELKLRLIKLDLEGFELSALRGCRRLIERFRPLIMCEVTEKLLQKYGHSANELILFFQELGYELHPPSGHGAIESFDVRQLSDPARQFDVLFAPLESMPLAVRSA